MERRSRMRKFLNNLEENAVMYDNMEKVGKGATVVGSSVGLTGGVCTIAGLVLSPFTAGLSLGFTMTGLGLGLTSGAVSLATMTTEIGVNTIEGNKANKALKSFMEDAQVINEHLEEVSNRETDWEKNVALGVSKILGKCVSMNRAIDSFVDCWVQAERVAARAASDIPDVGQAAAKGALGLSKKAARVGMIALNGLFIGLDAVTIYQNSSSLAKGVESEMAKFIRAKVQLWRSEMNSWQKIHDCLSQGREKSVQRNQVLTSPFYPLVCKKSEKDEFPRLCVIFFIFYFLFWAAWMLVSG